MTLYRLYLRSRVRRERLPLGQTGCDAETIVPSPAGREERPAVIYGNHRYSYAIIGSEEFEAENDAAALVIARNIFDAGADLCDVFDLWDGTRQIDQSRVATLQTNVISARWQDQVMRAEEALLNSGWAIAHSRRLLARFNELRAEATGDDPISPVTTSN